MGAGLREQAFGRIDGRRVEDIKRDHADVWAGWTQFQSDYVVPDGESTRQFHTRVTVSYTHLDVYKRQPRGTARN